MDSEETIQLLLTIYNDIHKLSRKVPLLLFERFAIPYEIASIKSVKM